MPASGESDIAWTLVDLARSALTTAETTEVYVHLGIGDYLPALRMVFEAMSRSGHTLSAEMTAAVESVIASYGYDRELGESLARIRHRPAS
ncbi:hypothetical protein [Mycolicibacterium palauense]|uniref:hypothetical protein n=1 Tax=Mycolicibacterium palauense TaxID=2034511 RepID=UPI000BFEC4E4|nr:hypothetical protein [Mycolicibacterium palauense]